MGTHGEEENMRNGLVSLNADAEATQAARAAIVVGRRIVAFLLLDAVTRLRELDSRCRAALSSCQER